MLAGQPSLRPVGEVRCDAVLFLGLLTEHRIYPLQQQQVALTMHGIMTQSVGGVSKYPSNPWPLASHGDHKIVK